MKKMNQSKDFDQLKNDNVYIDSLKSVFLGALTTTILTISIVVLWALILASILGFAEAKIFTHSGKGLYVLVIISNLLIIPGGYVVGWKAKHNKIKNSIYLGALSIIISLLTWNTEDPLWNDILALFSPIPLAMLGAYWATKRRVHISNSYVPQQSASEDQENQSLPNYNVAKIDLEKLKKEDPSKYYRTIYGQKIGRLFLGLFCLPISIAITYFIDRICAFSHEPSTLGYKFLFFFMISAFISRRSKLSGTDRRLMVFMALFLTALVILLDYLSIPFSLVLIGLCVFTMLAVLSTRVERYIMVKKFGNIVIVDAKQRAEQISENYKNNEIFNQKNKIANQEYVFKQQNYILNFILNALIVALSLLVLSSIFKIKASLIVIIIPSALISGLLTKLGFLKRDTPFYVAAIFLLVFIALILMGISEGIAVRKGLPEDTYLGPAIIIAVIASLFFAQRINNGVSEQNKKEGYE